MSDAGQTVDVMLVGDSHMWALTEELRGMLEDVDVGYYAISHKFCLPLPGFRAFDAKKIVDCQDFLAGAYDWAQDADVRTVVIAARFPFYLRGNRYDNGEGGVETGEAGWVDLAESQNSEWNDTARRERVLAAYESRIRELAEQFNVVLVYPIPEAGWNVPGYAFKNAFFYDGDVTLTTSYSAYRERTQEVNALFDRLVADIPKIHAARVHEVLCSRETDRCVNADADGVYYYDDDHLSNAGARLVAPVIIDSIEAALKQATAAKAD